MADQRTHQNSQDQDALRTTLTALMLDVRLTPLERNGWQVLHMLRTADGLSPLVNMGQLRRYLTCTPCGQRAGAATAWRALAVLRLTGWVSFVRQHCDLLTGNVQSVLYRVNERALSFHEACALDDSLEELMATCIGHENKQIKHLAEHILATSENTPEHLPIAIREQRNKDDEPPPSAPSRKRPTVNRTSTPSTFTDRSTVTQQTKQTRQIPREQDRTYKPYLYKKERTYRAHTREESDSPSEPLALPPCLASAKADQQRDVLAALKRLPSHHRQDVLDELQARSQSGTVRNVVAYFFALVKRVLIGEFRLWAGRKKQDPAGEPVVIQPAPRVYTDVRKKPPAHSAWREIGRPHIANMRKILAGPRNAGDLAAQVMKSKEWQPCPA
ncbi:STY4528 family pathogenicity island replication protein [Pseudomonas sp. N-137]|uniref:STY4528 family pathogenicity island replication protein n=1 Tax=Pseudomonas sp. N-137 TaxID=3108452 RepID=UPI002ADEACD2|nr:STY4528 family pathogenicity island replication protein [Pseudomonas sp. N-137]MEA1030619.1 STY4528 family pathogenicity island replication protein [Pseudomonas sp. N-137]